jgi:hypothetical protein
MTDADANGVRRAWFALLGGVGLIFLGWGLATREATPAAVGGVGVAIGVASFFAKDSRRGAPKEQVNTRCPTCGQQIRVLASARRRGWCPFCGAQR